MRPQIYVLYIGTNALPICWISSSNRYIYHEQSDNALLGFLLSETMLKLLVIYVLLNAGTQTRILHSDTQVRHSSATATGQWALYIRSYVICFHTKACWHGIRCGGTYCLWNHHNKLGRMVASPGDLASILHYNNPVLQEPHVAWWPGTAPGLAPGCRGSHNTHRCLFYNLSFQLNTYS